MKIKTSITDIQDGKEIVRGHELASLMRNNSFSEIIFLILQSRLPSDDELKMFDAILGSIIDHGPAVASALAARISASAGNSMHSALAAGILGFGSRHGVAVEDAMKFLQTNASKTQDELRELLADMKQKKEYVPGFGHKLFTENDPRSVALFDIAGETNFYGKHCEFVHTLYTAINESSSKLLPINIDGAIAAILSDMGFDARLGKGIFIIGRIPGLVAHVYEEMIHDVGIRRLEQDEIEFAA